MLPLLLPASLLVPDRVVASPLILLLLRRIPTGAAAAPAPTAAEAAADASEGFCCWLLVLVLGDAISFECNAVWLARDSRKRTCPARSFFNDRFTTNVSFQVSFSRVVT